VIAVIIVTTVTTVMSDIHENDLTIAA